MRAIITLLAGLPLGIALLPSIVRAETHGITVMNRSGDTLRSIQIAPAGATSYGVNRLRSQLPPGAEARISYSAGCPVDLRLAFDGGRVEDRRDLDACANPHVLTGSATPKAAGAAPVHTSTVKHKGAATLAGAAPPPPWTGRSITKRFGGLD